MSIQSINNQPEIDLIEEALAWAEQGIPVFPTGEDKRPLTKNGHKDASTDFDTVEDMFENAGNRLHGIGARMGRDAGLFAIDADLYKLGEAGESAKAFLADLERAGLLPETQTHRTRNGGVHYIFESETDWPNVNPVSGVEVKGEGGYIILPPTPGYSIVRAGFALAPAALIARLRAAKSAQSSRSIDELKAAVLRGDDFHEPLTQIAAKLAADGQPIESVQGVLMNTLAASAAMLPNHPRHDRWRALVENQSGELSRIVESANRKFNPNIASDALREAAGPLFADSAPDAWSEEASRPADSLRGAGPRRGFSLVPVGALELREPQFLIADLIEEGALVQIFGEPGAGKSLIAYDMAACVAAAQPFHGRAVAKSGPVIVLAGEGHNGIKRRFAAWEKLTGRSLDEAPLLVSQSPAQLLDPASVKEVALQVDEVAGRHGNPVLVVVDTLARNFGPGDENSNRDMSEFVAVLDALKARYGCTVLLVHHSGHGEAGRARGASALRAAVDAEFSVRKAGAGALAVSCTKMKDAPETPDFAFTIESVALGLTADGQPITGPALRETAPPVKSSAKPLSAGQKLAVQAFHAARSKAGATNADGIHAEKWRAAFYKISTADSEDSKRKAFNRARADLQKAGVLLVEDDFCTLTGEHARPDDAAFTRLSKPKSPPSAT
jgi:KaiC/GvpD/RAD55 family RecA-like ATPase